MKLGLDFGTTNSSLSLLADGKVTLLPIDNFAKNPEVIRSALYFYPRKLVLSESVTQAQIQTQTFNISQIHYEGKVKTSIGNEAVETYLKDNKNRRPGVHRIIYTGRTIRVITWVNPYSGRVYTEDIPEALEEIDYRTGHLFHALKTALKSPYYKGSAVFGDFFSLEKLISIYLTEVKKRAEDILGVKFDEVTIGRPVYFSNDKEKDKIAQNRLEEAVKMAEFKKIDFMFEPIGAAKYYLYKKPEIRGKILVFDFGGGTLDTTIVEKNGDKFEILTTDGVYIGGDLLNSDIFFEKLGNYFGLDLTWGDHQTNLPYNIRESLTSWFGIINLNSPDSMQTLEKAKYKCSDLPALERLIYLIKTNLGFEIYNAIEKAKEEISSKTGSDIEFSDGPINIIKNITRVEFERLIKPRIEEAKKVCLRTLKNAKTDPDEIKLIIATGGSSLIPLVKNMLEGVFGKDKIEFFETFTSVAAGLVL